MVRKQDRYAPGKLFKGDVSIGERHSEESKGTLFKSTLKLRHFALLLPSLVMFINRNNSDPRMLEKLVSHSTLHTGAHLGFFSGVGMMLSVLGTAWNLHIKPWLYSPYGFYIGLGLVVLSVVVLAFLAGSVSKWCRSIGWMLVIPGVVALLFAAFGELNVYSWANQHITGFATAEPVVSFLVDHSVPKTTLLGGFYILLGISLVWLGGKIGSLSEHI